MSITRLHSGNPPRSAPTRYFLTLILLTVSASLLSLSACKDEDGGSTVADADDGDGSETGDADADAGPDADGDADLDTDDGDADPCPTYRRVTDEPYYGYVSSLALAPSDCCYTGINDTLEIDNSLGELVEYLSSIDGFGDAAGAIQNFLAVSVARGTLQLAFRVEGATETVGDGRGVDASTIVCPPAPAAGSPVDVVGVDRFEVTEEPCSEVSVETDCTTMAEPQCTANGVCAYPSSPPAEREAGDGEYTLEGSALGAGSDRFLDGQHLDGRLLVPSNDKTLSLRFDLGLGFAGQVVAYGMPAAIVVPVHGVTFDASVEEVTSSLAPPAQRGLATTEPGIMGGALPLSSMLDLLNPFFDRCFDASVPEALTIDESSDDDRQSIVCDEGLVADHPGEFSGLCGLFAASDPEDAGPPCGIFDSILGSRLDVDVDGDGQRDALSFGLHFELIGASRIGTSD